MAKFYAVLRKLDGSYYMKKSILGIHKGLRRHFIAVRSIDIAKVDLLMNPAFKSIDLSLCQRSILVSYKTNNEYFHSCNRKKIFIR